MNPFRPAAKGAFLAAVQAGALAAAGAFALPCPAEIMLAAPFTDHAVLQRDEPVPVWGRAGPGARITVAFRGQKLAATAGADGRWQATLAPMAAAADGADLVVTGPETVVRHDVVVGEVWLASGQSNMEWPLSLARDGAQEVAAAGVPLVRHLLIDHSPADAPAETVKTSGWEIATPQTAGAFTAVGYFFARALSRKLGVPVGIIHSSWGGTPIESWLAEEELRKTSAWPRFETEWEQALKVFPQKQAEYPALDAAWRKADEEERATGKKNPLPWPHPPVGPGTAYAPGGLFNGMIAPLVPYALRGVLWYQGESNVGETAHYAELFVALIRDWRRRWAGDDFPFYFVQIPNFADGHPDGRQWALLREAQARALSLPNVGMVVTIDVGEPDNLHPPDKKPVGERLAMLAAARTYGQPGASSGPTFQTAIRTGAAMRLRFAHAGGLIARVTPLTGFEIAGADRVFHPALARIEDASVVVASPDVPEPVAVRYAFTNSPVALLFNAAGLPAAPFRTDDW